MKNLKEGLEIFCKYDPNGDVCAQHDVIYAGVELNNLTNEDKETLEKLGWHWDKTVDSWGYFT